jgi:hypothetical protein
MASLEDKLVSWIGPSSPTEQEKQDRTERMVTEAVRDHPGLKDCTFTVYTKGSYPNNTNVKADSDVDVAVQCSNVFYWDAAEPEAKRSTTTPYTGIWTPSKLRAEVLLVLEKKFPGQVDSSGPPRSRSTPVPREWMLMCFRVSTIVTTSPPAVSDKDRAPSKRMETR